MIKKILLGFFFTSCFYFMLYYFSTTLRLIIANGGFWSYLHVVMSILLFVGSFLILVSILRYLFVE